MTEQSYADKRIAEHKRFTAEGTAYLRNLNREDLNAQTYAVLYQDTPVKTDTGLNSSIRFPVLIAAYYVEKPDEFVAKVARILEKHWDDAEEAGS